MITRGSESSHGAGVANTRFSFTVQASVFVAMLVVVGILSVGAAALITMHTLWSKQSRIAAQGV